MKRAFVFIDGSNFYFRLKDLTSKLSGRFSLLDYHFREFSEWLVRPNKLEEIHYYVGAIKRKADNEKVEKMYADQQRLIAKLEQQNVFVTLGQLIRHPDKTYHEKGVDVRLAVEMIRFARENKYDCGYLLSSDTDLVPAIEEVKSFGKTVQYVGTAKGQSFGISKVANDVRLLRAEEIEKFLPKSLV